MEIIIFKERENHTQKVSFSGTNVKDLLGYLQINPETVLVVRSNEVITEDELLNEGESLKLFSVISGG